jgi:hypothetical protein
MDRFGNITLSELGEEDPLPPPNPSKPVTLSYTESLLWVIRAIIQIRGSELFGSNRQDRKTSLRTISKMSWIIRDGR